MRALPAALLACLALVPAAGAGEAQDMSIGANLGYFAPGLWDAFYFTTVGGAVTVTLTWEEPDLFPFADYDVRVYKQGALSDDYLADAELLVDSSDHPYAHHDERIDTSLAPGTYVIAVVPFQAQLEKYTLRADPGDLFFARTLVGYTRFQ